MNPSDVPSGAFPLTLVAVPLYFSVSAGTTLNWEGWAHCRVGPQRAHPASEQAAVTAAKRCQGEK